MNKTMRRGDQKRGMPLASPSRLSEDGQKLLARGAAAQALDLFAKAVRLAPETPEHWVNLSRAQIALDRRDRAVATLRKALALFPAMADLYGSLGNVQEGGGGTVPALQSYRRALRIDRNHFTAPDLDRVMERLGRTIHSWHLPMLGDALRNDAYQAAIEAAVRPDDVVLDIGAGSGLLSLMAARAGAKQVYGCEMLTDLAELAKLVVAKNGYSDRITILPKPSGQLEVGSDLPTRATLLVTETFDSMIVGEGILPSLAYAHDHLLAPGARVIPASATLKGQLVTIPRLKALYPLRTINGFDLSPFAMGSGIERFYPAFPDCESFTPLTAVFELNRFDFSRRPAMRQSWSVEAEATADGTIQAVLLSFDLHLDDRITLSTTKFGDIKHWNPVFYIFDTERQIRQGERIAVSGRADGQSLILSI